MAYTPVLPPHSKQTGGMMSRQIWSKSEVFCGSSFLDILHHIGPVISRLRPEPVAAESKGHYGLEFLYSWQGAPSARTTNLNAEKRGLGEVGAGCGNQEEHCHACL